MYVLLWRFRPLVGRQSDFERAYGPSGPWVRLFRRGEGYLGTELLRRSDDSGEYLVLDRWASRAAYENIPSPLGQRLPAAGPSIGRAHRGGDSTRRLRGAPLRSPARLLGCSFSLFFLPLFTKCVEVWNSRKSVCRILHIPPVRTDVTPLRPGTHYVPLPYILWC